MSTPESEFVDAIASALSRLRSPHRGPHPHGHGGPHHHHGAHGHHGGPGLMRGGPARMRMLETLAAASDPLSVSEIGDAIGVDQPRASRLVQQGVALGLVVREADPDDARRTRIALTDDGRRIAQGMRGQRRNAVGKALETFSPAERAELARLLGKLADNWER